MSRLLVTNKSFELLEPYEGKLSRTVLRGESSRKGADLLDMDGEQVCRYLGISGRTLQRLRSDHVITYSAINRKLYYSLTEIRRVLKERSVRRKNQPKE